MRSKFDWILHKQLGEIRVNGISVGQQKINEKRLFVYAEEFARVFST